MPPLALPGAVAGSAGSGARQIVRSGIRPPTATQTIDREEQLTCRQYNVHLRSPWRARCARTATTSCKKNRRNDPDRLELKKFCPNCGKHQAPQRVPLTVGLSKDLVGTHYRYPTTTWSSARKVRGTRGRCRAAIRHAWTTTPRPNSAAGVSPLRSRSCRCSATSHRRDARSQQHRYHRPADRPGGPGGEVLQTDRRGRQAFCDSYIDDIRQAHGADIIVNKVVVTNQDGETVQRLTRRSPGGVTETERVALTMALREFGSVKVGDELPQNHQSDQGGPGELCRGVR